jgi:hypothetical protein
MKKFAFLNQLAFARPAKMRRRISPLSKWIYRQKMARRDDAKVEAEGVDSVARNGAARAGG